MSGGLKKKGLEWDLNGWRWDGNLFLATPSNTGPSEYGYKELGGAQEEIDFGVVEKRRRVWLDGHEARAEVVNGEHGDVVAGMTWTSEEERPMKNGGSNACPSCQVDGCRSDLSNARDYHRRHKVCEMHSRATVVLLKNTEHRFCQQCSRFHLLQEFDDGKKSCRQRLARHNGRRRKVQNQSTSTGNSLSDNQSLSYTLLLLLKKLASLESGNSSEQTNGPNHLVNLLKNLATITSSQASRDMHTDVPSATISPETCNAVADGFTTQEPTRLLIPVGIEPPAEEPPANRRLKDFDLNDAYMEEDQSRTDRIVFKLFGKEPNDFPINLRSQILNWLSHYPSDMESYIRPGCVILTVYLRLPNWMWDELEDDLTTWIEKLLNMSIDGFWRTGWIYARVQDYMTLICNGTIVLVSPWQPRIGDRNQILCVTPIAVPCSSTANFSVKGFNLNEPSTKLLCVFGGKYLIQEAAHALVDDTSTQKGLQCLTFSCSFQSSSGRGFIEVEDYDHSSLSVPFVVAEESVCSEIRMMEKEINDISCNDLSEGGEHLMDARDRALEFLQEIGWLLQRSQIQATSEQPQNCFESFPVARFRWLLSFAMEREWCAVVKKLLDTLFQGNIDLDGCSPVEFALREDLVCTAVKRRSKPLVEFLLRYATRSSLKDTGVTAPVLFLFRPEITGPSNVTPLHIAATISDAAGVLDALTDDPQLLGIHAWKNVRDISGFTPEDYAQKRGHISYVQMVQSKIDRRIPKAHVSLAIPSSPLANVMYEKHSSGLKSTDETTLHVEKSKRSDQQQLDCRFCVQQLAYRPRANRFLSTRPAVLSLIAVAAVCVCVGLIMKSPPNVGYAKHPFLWHALQSGSI